MVKYLAWLVVGNIVSIGVLGTLMSWWLKSRLESSIKHEYDRKLESFKQEVALALEVSRQRVHVLAKIWEQLAEVEAACIHQKLVMGRHFWAVHQRLGSKEATGELPSGFWDMYARLEGLPDILLDAAGRADVDAALKSANERLVEQTYQAHQSIAKNRFWLGEELRRELKQYLNGMTEAFMNLTPLGTDRATFKSAVLTLKAQQGEAEKLLPRLRVSAV